MNQWQQQCASLSACHERWRESFSCSTSCSWPWKIDLFRLAPAIVKMAPTKRSFDVRALAESDIVRAAKMVARCRTDLAAEVKRRSRCCLGRFLMCGLYGTLSFIAGVVRSVVRASPANFGCTSPEPNTCGSLDTSTHLKCIR